MSLTDARERFAVVAEFRARPGCEDTLRAATLPLVARARSESTTLVFLLNEDREAPGHFVFYEIYASKAAFEAHVAQPHLREWSAMLPELTESGIRATHMTVLEEPELP